MLVFLSVLGIILLVGICCLCLAPNSTMLNLKRMWLEIKLSEEEEILFEQAGTDYDEKRNKVREKRKKRNRMNLWESRRGPKGLSTGGKSMKSPLMKSLEAGIK